MSNTIEEHKPILEKDLLSESSKYDKDVGLLKKSIIERYGLTGEAQEMLDGVNIRVVSPKTYQYLMGNTDSRASYHREASPFYPNFGPSNTILLQSGDYKPAAHEIAHSLFGAGTPESQGIGNQGYQATKGGRTFEDWLLNYPNTFVRDEERLAELFASKSLLESSPLLKSKVSQFKTQ